MGHIFTFFRIFIYRGVGDVAPYNHAVIQSKRFLFLKTESFSKKLSKNY